jgi:hypothetical protein
MKFLRNNGAFLPDKKVFALLTRQSIDKKYNELAIENKLLKIYSS